MMFEALGSPDCVTTLSAFFFSLFLFINSIHTVHDSRQLFGSD